MDVVIELRQVCTFVARGSYSMNAFFSFNVFYKKEAKQILRYQGSVSTTK